MIISSICRLAERALRISAFSCLLIGFNARSAEIVSAESQDLPEKAIQSATGCDHGDSELNSASVPSISTINKRLTPLWAQELIGSDLARNFLGQVSHQQTTSIGVADGVFTPNLLPRARISNQVREDLKQRYRDCKGVTCDNHGASVISNLADPVTGSSATGEVDAFSPAGLSGDAGSAIEALLKEPSIRVINVSQNSQVSDPAKIDALIAGKNALVVVAAGNGYPGVVETNLKNGIVVGSLSPLGTLSSFSEFGPQVDVVAPSDYFLLSRSGKISGYDHFGGTSGATPLVSGALADLTSLLPSIKADEAKLLLKTTSTQNDFFRTKSSGVGILNEYKLLRVAERLKEQGFEKMDSASRLSLLKKGDILNFPKLSAGDVKDLEQRAKGRDPCVARSALDRLREDALLTQNDLSLGALSRIYDSRGYTLNASLYATLQSGQYARSLEQGLNAVSAMHKELSTGNSMSSYEKEGLMSLDLGVARAAREFPKAIPSNILTVMDADLDQKLNPGSGGTTGYAYALNELSKIGDNTFQLQVRKKAIESMPPKSWNSGPYIKGLSMLGPDAVPLLRMAAEKDLDNASMGLTIKSEAEAMFEKGWISQDELNKFMAL